MLYNIYEIEILISYIDYKFIKLAGDEYFDKISNVFDNRLDKIKDK